MNDAFPCCAYSDRFPMIETVNRQLLTLKNKDMSHRPVIKNQAKIITKEETRLSGK